MKYSSLLIPTLKETPNDAEVISHQYMIRAGLIRKVASGIYIMLPLGNRVIQKFEAIVREEMNRSGAQEILMPSIIPADLWEQSGRWGKYGPELLRVKDRHGKDYCYGPTHEEVVTGLVKQTVKSYRDLPLNLYQIQTKFRDEIRPRFGLMRGREFGMKDAYSFHADEEGLNTCYEKMAEAYARIFGRCGLSFNRVEADSGNIGGSSSAEFMVVANTGEDEILVCDTCTYAANVEAAGLPVLNHENSEIVGSLERVHTPGLKTIEQVSGFFSCEMSDLVKSLVVTIGQEAPILVLIRGDRSLNLAKVAKQLGSGFAELASDDVVMTYFGVEPGYVGPKNPKMPIKILADFELSAAKTWIIGANEKDYHFKGTDFGDIPDLSYCDLRSAVAGDRCVNCDNGRYRSVRGIEVGHIFKLGETYSSAMGAVFSDKNGQNRPFIMGCYGIGIGRTVAATIEQHHDEKGIVWPLQLAPYLCDLILIGTKDPDLVAIADRVYQSCLSAGLEVIFDDRDCSPGIKFKDADLIGFPFQAVIGNKAKQDGTIEIKDRKTGEVVLVEIDQFVANLQSRVVSV